MEACVENIADTGLAFDRDPLRNKRGHVTIDRPLRYLQFSRNHFCRDWPPGTSEDLDKLKQSFRWPHRVLPVLARRAPTYRMLTTRCQHAAPKKPTIFYSGDAHENQWKLLLRLFPLFHRGQTDRHGNVSLLTVSKAWHVNDRVREARAVQVDQRRRGHRDGRATTAIQIRSLLLPSMRHVSGRTALPEASFPINAQCLDDDPVIRNTFFEFVSDLPAWLDLAPTEQEIIDHNQSLGTIQK